MFIILANELTLSIKHQLFSFSVLNILNLFDIIYCMKVYRYLSEEELAHILKNETDKIGAEYNNSKLTCNNHRYRQGVKYLHFFKHKDSIKYLKMQMKFIRPYYICEFNIPLRVLAKGVGKGYYDIGGMEYIIISQREFIVPAKDLKKEWLIGYKQDSLNATSEKEMEK